jgi:hypothetical protein
MSAKSEGDRFLVQGLEGVQHGVSDAAKETFKLKERIHILLNAPDSSLAATVYNVAMST